MLGHLRRASSARMECHEKLRLAAWAWLGCEPRTTASDWLRTGSGVKGQHTQVHGNKGPADRGADNSGARERTGRTWKSNEKVSCPNRTTERRTKTELGQAASGVRLQPGQCRLPRLESREGQGRRAPGPECPSTFMGCEPLIKEVCDRWMPFTKPLARRPNWHWTWMGLLQPLQTRAPNLQLFRWCLFLPC